MKATFRRLLGYLAGGRRKFLLPVVLLCLVASVVCNIAGTYYVNVIIINRLIAGDFASIGAFVLALVTLAGIYLVGVAASYAQAAIMARLAQRGVNHLRKDLFDHLQTLPLSYFDAHPHGELMSRFTNDADNVQQALEQSMVSLLSSVLMFTGLVAVMLFLSPPLFLVTLVTIAASFLVFKTYGAKSRRYFQAQQRALGAMNGNIQEMIEGLKVVKAFNHEEQAKADFARLNEDYRQAATAANANASAIMPLAVNITNMGYALTAAFGGVLSIVTSFNLGSLLGYLQYSRQISQPMNQMSQQMTTILSALAGAERIFQCMDTPPETDEGKVTLVRAHRRADGALEEAGPAGKEHLWAWKIPQTGELVELKGAVKVTGVDFGYVPDKTVLHDVSFYANPGQKIAFVGSTGAGKTTITNLINRFYEIQDGVITYDGINIREIAKDDLRRSLGAVLQDTHLFTGTVMDNIRYGRLEATDEECVAAAKTAGAHSFIRRLPEGYQTMVTGDGGNLSQGQRQLLAIARAAVADPPVMILDEATSSIDTRTEALIQKGMDALMEGRTVFVIAHRLSTVRNANAIMVLEGGRVIERGDHDDLLEQKGRYYQLYTGQFQLE